MVELRQVDNASVRLGAVADKGALLWFEIDGESQTVRNDRFA